MRVGEIKEALRFESLTPRVYIDKGGNVHAYAFFGLVPGTLCRSVVWNAAKDMPNGVRALRRDGRNARGETVRDNDNAPPSLPSIEHGIKPTCKICRGRIARLRAAQQAVRHGKSISM